jgi:hypothetical protein
MNVKSPNNTSKWQMGFHLAFKGLITSAQDIIEEKQHERNEECYGQECR